MGVAGDIPIALHGGGWEPDPLWNVSSSLMEHTAGTLQGPQISCAVERLSFLTLAAMTPAAQPSPGTLIPAS